MSTIARMAKAGSWVSVRSSETMIARSTSRSARSPAGPRTCATGSPAPDEAAHHRHRFDHRVGGSRHRQEPRQVQCRDDALRALQEHRGGHGGRLGRRHRVVPVRERVDLVDRPLASGQQLLEQPSRAQQIQQPGDQPEEGEHGRHQQEHGQAHGHVGLEVGRAQLCEGHQRVQRGRDEDAQRVLDHQVAPEAQHQPRRVLARPELDHHHRHRHHEPGEGDHAAGDGVQDLACAVGGERQPERVDLVARLQRRHRLAQRERGHHVQGRDDQPAAVEPLTRPEPYAPPPALAPGHAHARIGTNAGAAGHGCPHYSGTLARTLVGPPVCRDAAGSPDQGASTCRRSPADRTGPTPQSPRSTGTASSPRRFRAGSSPPPAWGPWTPCGSWTRTWLWKATRSATWPPS